MTKSGSSEYGKYLGLKVGTSDYELFAQGPDYVNLNAPQNQWVVTKIDGQKFTFTNREVNTYNTSTGAATGLSFTASLRKTDEANVYEVMRSLRHSLMLMLQITHIRFLMTKIWQQ